MKYFNTITFLFTFLLNTLSFQAENWELFPFNQKTYFYFETENSKTISPYYVDFEESEGNFIRQYPLKAYIEAATEGCYDNMNLEVYDLEGGDVAYNYHFAKSENSFEYIFDTGQISFYPQIEVGESWEIINPAFANRPYTRLRITCTAIEVQTLFSVTDNVKTFEIEAFDEEEPIDVVIENFSIKIGEKYGLIEWFDFDGWVFTDPTVKITLAGLEMNNGETIGEQMPKAADFYPYLEGSVLQWKEIKGQRTAFHLDSILSIEKTTEQITYVYNRMTTTEYLGEVSHETKLNEVVTLRFFPQHFINLHYWNLGMTDSGTYQTLNLNRLEENDEVEYTLTTFQNATFFNNCHISQLVDFGIIQNVLNTKVGIKSELEAGGFGGGTYNLQLQEALIGDDYYTPIEDKALPSLELTLSPNPTKNHLTLQTNTYLNTPIKLQICDLQGQSIFQAQFAGRIEVNVQDFPKGIYFVQASDGKNRWIKKVVKH